ncbi:MAG: penicillin-binding protein 2 [Anaerolineae bacterium]|nr:MAG: penicillin-binding protein 2 [Anaerolineae bacterium]
MNVRTALRFVITGALFLLGGVVIIARLVSLQVGGPGEQIREIEPLDGVEVAYLQPARGNIYDRDGYLLAGNQLIYEVSLELNAVQNPISIALAVSNVLGMDYSEVLRLASQDPETVENTHILLDYFVPYEQASRLIQLKEKTDAAVDPGSTPDGKKHSLRGLVISPRYDRSYPEGSLASNVLGIVLKDGSSVQGVEEKLQMLLSGQERQTRVSANPYQALNLPDTLHGADLVLTIDREIQAALEEVLDEHMGITGAKQGLIVVMDPRSGEILGMANAPRMDLSGDWDVEVQKFSDDRSFNMALDSYEPGSVFKIITMAAALDTGVVSPDTPFTDTGSLEVDGWTIRNWDGGAWGPQTMTTCMEHSLNVCLAWVATEKLGQSRFYQYVRAFQFGTPTGIELANESSGYVRFDNHPDWHPIDLATNSYGQGIMVTPLQMLRAVSALPNQGRMITPHILKAVVSRSQQYEVTPQYAGQPISAETAATLTEMLATIVESESYTEMYPGYRVAGKTGTGTIYGTSLTNASFIGWGPVSDPRFMVYVWLHKPTTSPWASLMAAPVFVDVVERLVVLMDIPPDDVRIQLGAQ